MTYRFKPSLILKETTMTLNESKTHDTSTASTAQQHHTQAAEHMEHAAKAHKEAAKLIGSNDHAGAQAHVKSAHEQAAKAQDHVIEATKKTAPAAK